jgi:FemAB-related protein (PEP-CTERM system-associated)
MLPNSQTVTEGAKLYSLATDENNRKWDSYVDRHPHGSIFHSSRWQRMIESSFHHRPFHLICEDGMGNAVGILPLFLVRSRIFGRMLVSTPQAAYGGILADGESIAVGLLKKANEISHSQNAEFLELRCFQNAVNDPDLVAKDLYVTFRQELFEDPEKNLLVIPRKTRAECRAGIKKGLEFKTNEIGVDRFYQVYSRSVRDLGTPVFSRRLFENGMREFGDKCKIFSVHWQGKLASAVWTLFYKDEVIPYYGGSIREYNHLGVNNFMYWMLIQYGCENGYRIFDFGRSKKGTGSFDFKKRWGMTMIDLPYQYKLIRRQSLPDTSPLNPKFAWAVRLWSKLPVPVANTLGPFISRNLI